MPLFTTPVSALVRRPVTRVEQTAPLREAVEQLRQAPSRCLAVMDGERLVGLFLERNMIKHCYKAGVDEGTPVQAVMTAPLVSVRPETSVVEALRLMDTQRIRHLPLVDEAGALRGLIRGRDLLEYVAEWLPQAILNAPEHLAPFDATEGA